MLKSPLLATAALLLPGIAMAQSPLPAFPGAEGFGASAKGGRGGAVHEVTTLADAGPGSLRACVEASGPRTCVFRVSGTIAADSEIAVANPFLTIAGQTSPGGVQVKAGKVLNAPAFSVGASDVIVRHVAFMHGPSTARSMNGDAIRTNPGADRVIFDHVDMFWGTDENIDTNNAKNVTVQWSMSVEGLMNSTNTKSAHAMGALLSGDNISWIRNLISTQFRRCPNAQTDGHFEMIDSVSYNCGQVFAETYDRTRGEVMTSNFVGNYFSKGPVSATYWRGADGAWNPIHEITLNDWDGAGQRVHVLDNLGIMRRSATQPQERAVDPKGNPGGGRKFLVSAPPKPLTTKSLGNPIQAYQDVLSFAGSGGGMEGRRRSSAALRAVANVRGCKGSYINSPAEVGGWPTLPQPPAPADADHDGMPDTWEAAQGLDENDPADRNADNDGDGYTELEEYLSDLAGDNVRRIGTGTGAAPRLNCGRG